jgi:hypothetical protein
VDQHGQLRAIVGAEMDDCAIDQPRRKKLSVGLPLFNFLCSGDHVLELYAGGEPAPAGKV